MARAAPGYGPWEQIAFNVADGMRRRGLDVTLFATANSRFDGKLVSVIPVGLNEDPALDGTVFSALHIGELFARANDFDLINNHFDWKPLTYALAARRRPDADDGARIFVAANLWPHITPRRAAVSIARSPTPTAIQGSTTRDDL